MATDSTATAPDVTASFRSDSDRSCSCSVRNAAISTPLTTRLGRHASECQVSSPPCRSHATAGLAGGGAGL